MPRSLSATPSRRKVSMERAPIWPHFTFGGSAGRAALSDDDIDASPGQIHGQRQSNRPAADDKHLRFSYDVAQGSVTAPQAPTQYSASIGTFLQNSTWDQRAPLAFRFGPYQDFSQYGLSRGCMRADGGFLLHRVSLLLAQSRRGARRLSRQLSGE